MKKSNTSSLVKQNIYLLIPLIIYAIYKNGYLIYSKNFISPAMIFKPVYLVLISITIKFLCDLIKDHRISFDYDLLYMIIIAMIMPYNINFLVYSISLIILFLLTKLIEKKLVFNKVCFIYLIIILINFIINDFTFNNLLEEQYTYSFSFLDLLMGRSVGGISVTSIFFSLLAYIFLINSFYYKKDIPFIINLVYLFLVLIYFIFTSDSSYFINSDLIFASIFIATLPIYSPYKVKNQIIYSIIIAILSFIITILFNSIVSIYLSIFIVSLFLNIKRGK